MLFRSPDATIQKNGLIVMRIDATGSDNRACGDQRFGHVVVLVNANKVSQTYAIANLAGSGMHLHPRHLSGLDSTVRGATFDNGTGTFTVPARTTAVFVQ